MLGLAANLDLEYFPLFLLLWIPISVYAYFRYINTYWWRNGVPYVPAVPVVGSLKPICMLQKSVANHFSDLYFAEEHRSESLVGMHVFLKPALMLRDLNLIKRMLITDFQSFNNRYSSSDIHTDLLGCGNLFFIKNPSWKHIRSRMTPFFSLLKLKNMYGSMSTIGDNLNELWLSVSSKIQPVHVNDVFARYTTDIIAKCAFGVDANSLQDPNSEFRQNGRKMLTFTWFRALEFSCIFFWPALVPFFGFKTFSKSASKFLRDEIGFVMDQREKSGDFRNDLIDTLIGLREEDKDKPFSTTNIVFQGDVLPAQAGSFFQAGFETTSSTLSFGLFEMCRRPEIQNRIREEIRTVMKDTRGESTYETLHRLDYLGMVISETLRMYPPLPFLDRECTVDGYNLSPYSDFIVPKGMPIVVPIYALHRDPHYWPHPDHFDPERFAPDNQDFINLDAYMPFGLGPHNCIAERFGLMQVRLGFVNFFRNHRVEPGPSTPEQMQLDEKALLLSAKGGIHLNIIRDPIAW